MKLTSTLTLLLLFFVSLTAKSQAPGPVVISQIYGGGGATSGTAPYLFDYVELHNRTSAPINLTNYSLQYGASSATSNFAGNNGNRFIIPDNTIILGGGYLLIQTASAGTVGTAFPVTPDFVTTNLNMSATNGKLLLLSDTTRINCGGSIDCPVVPVPFYVDLVGYGTATTGTSAPAYEGSASANNGASISNRVAAVRKGGGCHDTNDNAADFDTIPNPVPHNSASPVNICIVPVKLNTFNVVNLSNIVKINWATETELNSRSFIIERSENGTNWSAIGNVDAAGYSTTTKNYTFNDNVPAKGMNYYRLKLVDINGMVEYSSIKRTLIDSKMIQAVVSPNPAKDFINLYITKDNNLPSRIMISDMNGKQVRSAVSNDSYVQLSTMGLNKGVYFIKVMTDRKITTQKVIVQ